MEYLEKMNQFCELIYSNKKKDEICEELFQDLLTACYEYAQYRYAWMSYSSEEKQQQDQARTISHNRAMDAVVIYLRYLEKLEFAIPDLSTFAEDRKIFGNLACYILFYGLALEA